MPGSEQVASTIGVRRSDVELNLSLSSPSFCKFESSSNFLVDSCQPLQDWGCGHINTARGITALL